MTIIGARYDREYSLTADDLNILAPCVRPLLDHTETICTGHLRWLKDDT